MRNLSILIMTLVTSSLFSQQNKELWTQVTLSRTAQLAKEHRNTMPDAFDVYLLETTQLKTALLAAPMRSVYAVSSTLFTLPVDGSLKKFKVIEAPVIDASLNNIFPDIRSYAAQGIDDPAAVARISLSKNGLHAMVMSPHHKTVYVDPYTQDKDYYISYSRDDLPADPNGFECGVVADSFYAARSLEALADQTRNADDGLLRTFRLAIAATGEYSQFHINNQGIPSGASDTVKKEAVLAAMNTTMTRVNGVFERDLGITMVIIADNTDIIFLDAATDGLTNNNPNALINQSQTVIDNEIGSSNYDIGHTFSTQGGGLAQLNSPCVNGQKARGITGINSPIGDSYNIDYVSHEMGHQYGGNHPQNNNCQRSNVSIEPGSASTIMGYAGVCAPNVQNNSDDYFNGVSIVEMWNNISGGNSQCAGTSNTGNNAPTANAGANRNIPKSTPFILEGMATDADGNDVLSYCWEQRDAQVGIMPPQSTNSLGPMFRSLDPVATPNRYMPALPTVLNGQTGTTWERLASVQRNMRFRLTVRDNVAGGANSASDDVILSVSGSAGPFLVNSPTNGITWSDSEANAVSWDVANTDQAPINAANVDIILSTNGGVTFDQVLVANTPNDGFQSVPTPSGIETTQARIMVRASDNIFYNVNGSNFTITQALGINNAIISDAAIYPNPTTGVFTVQFSTSEIANTEISLYDVSGRLVDTQEFETNGSLFSQTLNYSTLETGMYFVKIKTGDIEVSKQLIKR